jgi:hypothetical protein
VHLRVLGESITPLTGCIKLLIVCFFTADKIKISVQFVEGLGFWKSSVLILERFFGSY